MRNGDVGVPYTPAQVKPLAVRIIEGCCAATAIAGAGWLWLYAITGGVL